MPRDKKRDKVQGNSFQIHVVDTANYQLQVPKTTKTRITTYLISTDP